MYSMIKSRIKTSDFLPCRFIVLNYKWSWVFRNLFVSIYDKLSKIFSRDYFLRFSVFWSTLRGMLIFLEKAKFYELQYQVYYFFNIFLKRKYFAIEGEKGLLSIIVVTYNSGHCLDEALWITGQDLGIRQEVIVIDNNSVDRSYLRKYEFRDNFKIIYKSWRIRCL